MCVCRQNIECSFARVYFEAQIIRVNLGINNVTAVRLGWCLKESFEEMTGECEFIALGNRYFANEVKSVLTHKQPYRVALTQELSVGFTEGDIVVCAADFEDQVLRFFINGKLCVKHPMPESFREGTLHPFVGLAVCLFVFHFFIFLFFIMNILPLQMRKQKYNHVRT
ncbi:hypothetical protein RFI_00562 [Reticulomyxa filosa]|uniref:SPRY domain-containing protein n=1 Tax=Reticulomyxa filosa TaxID=46433 RepID=X6PDD4_RETFI|nr:hypothetical protein RFI_00562 [Reticulomyxa filosa]|eukprot:ETO36495.1 hypothetical protein RFI_00562 [Reticulomyxa filosa]